MGHHCRPALAEPVDRTAAAGARCSLDHQKAGDSLWSGGLPGETLPRMVAGDRELPEGAAGGFSTLANYWAWKVLTKS